MKDKKDFTVKDGVKLYLGTLLAQCLVAVGIILGILLFMLVLGALLP
jgi:hypothetical protein